MAAADNYVLAALAYFDLFNYPLTEAEIYLFLPAKRNREDVNDAINSLVFSRQIFRFGRFFALRNDNALVENREAGNLKAAKMLVTAKKVSKLLMHFPFVRGVAVSGSLSKNYAAADSDIDLFVITSANRLWLARTLMHCLKKVSFLFRKQHHFCMNYYVDEAQLEIAEKNLYTATEVVTLMPMEGDLAFEKFYSANGWTQSFLPNNLMRITSAAAFKLNPLKFMFEQVFNNRIGNMLDRWLMKITADKWLKKTQQRKLNMRGLVMTMKAATHCAKPDPQGFQEDLIRKYEIKLVSLVTQPGNEHAAISFLTK